MTGNSALTERIRKSLLSSGIDQASAQIAANEISKNVKDGTGMRRYVALMEKSEILEDLIMEQLETQ